MRCGLLCRLVSDGSTKMAVLDIGPMAVSAQLGDELADDVVGGGQVHHDKLLQSEPTALMTSVALMVARALKTGMASAADRRAAMPARPPRARQWSDNTSDSRPAHRCGLDALA